MNDSDQGVTNPLPDLLLILDFEEKYRNSNVNSRDPAARCLTVGLGSVRVTLTSCFAGKLTV